jgi:hypothetical protein
MSTRFTRSLDQNVNGASKYFFAPVLYSRAHLRPSVSGLRKQWCPEIVDLIERMWAQDHQDRPTMTEVVTELEELVRKHK